MYSIMWLINIGEVSEDWWFIRCNTSIGETWSISRLGYLYACSMEQVTGKTDVNKVREGEIPFIISQTLWSFNSRQDDANWLFWKKINGCRQSCFDSITPGYGRICQYTINIGVNMYHTNYIPVVILCSISLLLLSWWLIYCHLRPEIHVCQTHRHICLYNFVLCHRNMLHHNKCEEEIEPK